MWDSVDWRITTSTSSNIWGRGRNARFGKCAILGSHNPTRRRVILYKVLSTPADCEVAAVSWYACIRARTLPLAPSDQGFSPI